MIYKSRHILPLTILMAALLTGGHATAAGVVVRGDVYGGGNLANVGQSVTVNISGGEVDGDVYGGGAKAYTNKDNWNESTSEFTQTYHEVTLEVGTSLDGYYTDANGAAPDANATAQANTTYYKKTETIVNLTGGEIKGDLYGGGLGYNDTQDDTKDKPANVYGDVTVTVNGANAKARDVFGANNILGTPMGVVAVNIENTSTDGLRNIYGGGNQATYQGNSTTVTITNGKVTNIYGGGLSADVAGSVTVNIQGGTVTTDVYGGGALGHTNIDNWNSGTNTLATTYTTTVNLDDGSIGGDVYGGGLGQKAKAESGTPGQDNYSPALPAIEAKVYGNVTVNIGATDGAQDPTYTGNITISGSVFGCNNLNGTPKGDVVVNVYKTAHTNDDIYPSDLTNFGLSDLNESSDSKYAIKAVYGGGNLAHYIPVATAPSSPVHSTTVHIYKCDENTVKAVYGGGNAADVGKTGENGITANTNVIIEGGRFYNVFGGGNGAGADNPGANIYGTATTQIQGGLYYQLFGGSDSKGDINVVDLSIESLCTLMVNESFGGANKSDLTGDVITTLSCSGDMAVGDFYGGSNQANINGNVTLNVYGGEFNNVYGGSKGTTLVPAHISGDVTLNLYGGTMENAFGGSNINGNIGGKITVNVLNNGGYCALEVNNIYGGGNVTPYTPTYALQEGETERISPVVNLIHGTVANVFGGAKGATATVTASPQVNIGYDATMGDLETENTLLYSITRDKTNYTSETTPANFTATVSTNVYGGGDLAQVAGSTTVNMWKANSSVDTIFGGGNKATISGNTAVNVYNGTVTHDVYGGGALANVGSSASGNTPATTHQVTIAGGTIIGSVYGGGLGRLANGNDPNAEGYLPSVAADVYGNVTVTTNGGTAQNVFGCNNYLGSPQLTVDVVIGGGTFGKVYGGGNLAAYTGTGGVSVLMTNGTADYVYGGGLGETAVVNGNTSVTISGNTANETLVNYDVYGGGSMADVTQDVTVSIEGGRILNDVYGGGALANTNTDNWNENTSTLAADVWSEVTGLMVGSSKVFGFYTSQNTNSQIKDADALATANTTYYRYGTPYKTLVSLTGGVIGHLNNNTADDYLGGNVYGGGLGRMANGDDPEAEGYRAPIEATVYGDVEVTLDGTAFIQRSKIPTKAQITDPDPNPVPFSGRVFGCNNLNGSPKSNVTVRILKTVMLDAANQPTTGHDENKFDVHSVYGGGNLSPYQPIDNTKTIWVIVNGCDDVTIEKVFGGGNSAGVPDTKVLILACLKIGYAFGGGNGADKIWNGAGWDENDGAPVTNTTTIMAYGGRLGQVFSGSDTKGDVQQAFIWLKGKADASTEGFSGGDYISNYCPLRITNSYGAGRGADINGDVNFIVSGCTQDDEIENVFGGSYDANIRGNITLTITSGILTHVFGGNDHGGTVGGNITVNIEETAGCAPIIIQHLYGGGREAAYPGTGAKKVTGSSGTGDNITYTYENVTSGNITVNIKSATRIDNVYGGSYKATTSANTEVNINMIKGSYANHIFTLPAGYRGNPIPNSNMTVTYVEVTGIEVGETVVAGYYTFDSQTNTYKQITSQEAKAESGVTYYLATSGSIKIHDDIGTIGNVYGGCYESEGFLSGNATINIGTETTAKVLKRRGNDPNVYVWGGDIVDNSGVKIYEGGKLKDGKTVNDVAYDEYAVLGAHITGNVYGGGCLADIGRYDVDHDNVLVTGNTSVNIGAKNSAAVAEGTSKVTIAGNVYGGGEGSDLTFKCEEAMVTGSTNVVIGNGTVSGTIYGGGKIGRVEKNTTVTIGLTGEGASAPIIRGNVFGAGKGVNTHGYSALVRGNTYVTVQADAKVGLSVYGGGEIASVGRYKVADATYNAENPDVGIGMPYALADENNEFSGYCNVTIKGNAEIGPDNMVMNNTTTHKPDDYGHVFGAGRGVLPYADLGTENNQPGQPRRMLPSNAMEYFTQAYYSVHYPQKDEKEYEDDYLKYIETLALATQTNVVIGGKAFVKGSVYGGSENGIVQHDTHVTIQDHCQIGAGKEITTRYEDYAGDNIFEMSTPPIKSGSGSSAVYYNLECNSWPYGEDTDEDGIKDLFEPYDKFTNASGYYDNDNRIYAEGGRPTGSDGHTFYGNVFGGGSGYYPYAPGKWHHNAGTVYGNTYVTVTGGHILTNLYGGNEMTNVGKGEKSTNSGKCTIEFGGTATLGVPRTMAQIDDHPVTCYLFGGGKGDQRIFFNKQTNLNDVDIKITGGKIFGSVFGGGEDGHVYHDVNIVIGDEVSHTGPTIGTWGTSYVDGNVFGGGRGFAGDAYTAGNVGGSVYLNIHGGHMLGSVYGGGRLGSVGYGLYEATTNGQPNPDYGEIRPDNKFDDGTDADINTGGGFKRGYITINITGGIIGNDNEYILVPKTITNDDDLTEWKIANNVPNTEYQLYVDDDYKTYRLSHTKGGNVFAGGMGRSTLLNGEPITVIDWKKLGNVKSTKLTITGGTIKSNVYGGGEVGSVLGGHSATVTLNDGSQSISAGTEISISGTAVIGTAIIDTVPNTVDESEKKYDDTYNFGSVYGGGKGSIDGGGDVKTNTYVLISSGQVMQNVYGGGQLGSVGTVTEEEIHNTVEDDPDSPLHYTYYDFGLGWPIKFTYQANTGSAYTIIKGGKIGTTGSDNGDVFGACKGTVLHRDNRLDEARIGNVNNTIVEIDYTNDVNRATADDYTVEQVWEGKKKLKLRMPAAKNGIAGSVYGGGEDGHVNKDTRLTLVKGLVGHALYGGGKGKGTYIGKLYDIDEYPDNPLTEKTYPAGSQGEEIYSLIAGRVYGNTYVTMKDGYVMRNIFGGGNLGSVGIGNYSGGSDDYSATGYGEMPPQANQSLWTNTDFKESGISTVTIEAGQIGYLVPISQKPNDYTDFVTQEKLDEAFNKLLAKDDLPTGNVFGGSRGIAAPNGSMSPRYLYIPNFFLGYSNETHVTIGTTTSTAANRPVILGSVYGGGQDGHVRRDASVTINNATVGVDYSQASDKLFTTDIKELQLQARGNVYGAGSGIGKFKRVKKDNSTEEGYNYSSGSVTCSTEVLIKDGTIYQNVYGGGALASIGPPNTTVLTPSTDDDKDDELDAPHDNTKSYSYTKVTIEGGSIGSAAGYAAEYGGNVYAASRGDESKKLPTTMYATDLWSKLVIQETDPSNKPTVIEGSVFGGGEFGIVKQGVTVDIMGGTIKHDVYGGGALASTQTSAYASTLAGQSTVVNLIGGSMNNAYGGGLGRLKFTNDIPESDIAPTSGNVTVNLNGLEAADYRQDLHSFVLEPVGSAQTISEYVVKGAYSDETPVTGAIVDSIFGANNLNGTPKGHIKIHVFATQNKDNTTGGVSSGYKYAKHPIRGDKDHPNESLADYLTRLIIDDDNIDNYHGVTIVETAVTAAQTANNAYLAESTDANMATLDQKLAELDDVLATLYDVQAVYGGGNLAAYVYGDGQKIENTIDNQPLINTARTEVIIDGCDITSIRQVYGGGNAASVPGTSVTVNGTYEIDEVFGGGNGKDDYLLNDVWYQNPGANVGYYNYTNLQYKETLPDSKKYYEAVEKSNASTREKREDNYSYGSGIANTDIRGGTIHAAYGGSNSKGNIRTTAFSVYADVAGCELVINETYGGGKNAEMDGEIDMTLDCAPQMDKIYGGARDANINNNVTVNITNGTFQQVFGGNNTTGTIRGSITVNVKEEGCRPIHIGALYGGGYKAPYSIYGYKMVGNKLEPRDESDYNTLKTTYNTLVSELENLTPEEIAASPTLTEKAEQRDELQYELSKLPYKDPRINVISATKIDTIYGGGFQALMVGNPHVNVNMEEGMILSRYSNFINEITTADGKDFVADHFDESDNLIFSGKEIKDGDYILNIGTIDNIFGGGNLANVIGNTYVEIGTGRWVASWDNYGNPIYETEVSGHKYYYKVKTPAEYYDQDDCDENNAALPGAINTSTVLTDKQVARLNELLSTDKYGTEEGEGKLQSPIATDAEAYNATLDGYITTADVMTPAEWAWYDENDNELANQTQPTPARNAANITGDVFGGGKGLTDNFKCDKAMVGAENEAANDPTKRNGGTNVIIANGTVGGSVYGGGMIARVEKNSAVTIGFESGIGNPIIEKDVFGAGMGASTHGYAGLVRGNSSVIIQGKSKVKGSVYGGGMQASIGRYFLDSNGLPIDLKSGGKATVIVRGDAEIGPDNMLMTDANGPQNTGHVFGAGKGILPYHDFDGNPLVDDPWRATPNNTKEYYSQDHEDEYINYINTLGITNKTEVTIGGNAFIKGSVYGGSENGYVFQNTHVTIQDNCQIGNGYVQMYDNGEYLPSTSMTGVNRRYTAAEWAAGHLYVENDLDVNLSDTKESALKAKVGNNYSNSLPECASFPYGETVVVGDDEKKIYAPYDQYAKYKNPADGEYYYSSDNYTEKTSARGGSIYGSDGHTFYGNVFGGGSGNFPYKPGKWHFRAGSVGGNTVVDITGGHILTSVYGGNEMTNVAGSATVNMTGGTLGVPRTLGQIAAHPVTCYLFGAGKGDGRTFFNTETNVASAQVNVTGNARIYGSVFGGGEDGHVLTDIVVNIGDNLTIGETPYTENGLIIGTTGTSYVDGNVFGAGRGFDGKALTAGSVGGNVMTNIKGGTMLGSIYGGGRLASVGIGFNPPTDAHYGQFTNDTDDKTYGHITVNISGGTIGNDLENQFFAVEVETYGKNAQEIESLRKEGLQTFKNNNKIPNTDFELYDSVLVEGSTTKYKYLYRTVHTKGGNVFGGSMGRLTLLDNSFNPLWAQLGQAKSTTVNITGGTIKSNVYGGGEIGTVRDNTYVTIGGIRDANGDVTASGSPTIYRDVYGGGYGSSINSEDSKTIVTSTNGNVTTEYGYSPLQWTGIVGIGTELNIYGGWIKKSVYGGGEMASVGIINYVLDETEYATEADVPAGKVIFRKNPTTNYYTVYANIVKHADETNSFALSWPYKFEYVEVPNGPSYLGTTKVNIKGGRIGITGKDFMGPFAANGVTAISPIDGHTLTDTEKKAARMDNGDVFGGGKGLAGDRYEMAFLANVGSTEVTIEYPSDNGADADHYKDKAKDNEGNSLDTYANDCITGSVYAGAENGHVMGNTQLTLKNGLVGHAIYGGGKGKGTYSQKILKIGSKPTSTNPLTYPASAYTNVNIYSITAGKVYGNTKVDMSGGIVVRNVYGGGNMGSVGKGNYAGGTDDYSYAVVNNNTYNGYGEAINANLWQSTNEGDDAWQFLNSGKTEVNITGGTIGYIKKTDAEDSMKDGLPYGNVFGGCRGESAPNISESPRYHYSPQFYSGYVNESKVTIGATNSTTGPTILGSVYGGGQDGHVRRDASVTIYSGEIGKAYSAEELNITDLNNPVWLHRGNVYGAGSGIGQYEYDFNYNGRHTVNANGTGGVENYEYTNPLNGRETTLKEIDYSTSAGSVTRFTNVEINGGTIHRNVYGGGSLASVGAPKIPPTRSDNPYYKDDPDSDHGPGKQSLNEVIINGGTIGDVNSRTVGYGGNVYGASRGLTELDSQFATSVWTKVEANSGYIYGNVFGGGEAGSVTMDTKVIIGDTPTTGSGAPRRTAPAVQPNAADVQPNAAAPAINSTNTSTPANVSTEAPDARTIRVNRANQ